MRLICTAWGNVSNETIKHCWQKTSILPVAVDSDFLNQAANVVVLINNPEQESVLAGINECYRVFNQVRPNHVNLSIEALVNPEEENDTLALESLNEDEIVDYITTNREMEENSIINEEEEEEEEVRPAMSAKAALLVIEDLEQFMELENGQEFRNAADSLACVKRTLRMNLEGGKTQEFITSYFEIQ